MIKGCLTCPHAALRFNNGNGATTCSKLNELIVNVGIKKPVTRPEKCPLPPDDPADDSVTLIRPDHHRPELAPYPNTLRGWQALVEGPIEVVCISNERLLVVNEEGLPEGLAVNYIASEIAGADIVGPVVLVEGPALERWNKEG